MAGKRRLLPMGTWLKRESDRQMQCTDRVMPAPIQVVTILEPGRADDGAPANAAAGRVKSFVPGIIRTRLSEADRVKKTDHRPKLGQQLFELHVGLSERLGAQLMATSIQRRSFALLIAAHRIFAAWKEAFVEGKFFIRSAGGKGQAMGDAE